MLSRKEWVVTIHISFHSIFFGINPCYKHIPFHRRELKLEGGEIEDNNEICFKVTYSQLHLERV